MLEELDNLKEQNAELEANLFETEKELKFLKEKYNSLLNKLEVLRKVESELIGDFILERNINNIMEEEE